MIVNRIVTIQESEQGTYISPDVQHQKDLTGIWSIWIYQDGSAEIYTKRKADGAFLGKPIYLPAPSCDHDTEKQPDALNPYKSDNFICKHCKKEFRKT